MAKITILGIQIDKIKHQQILNWLDFKIRMGEPGYITTPNPEIILNAQKNEELFFIINYSDIVIPDGIGLKFAAWLMGENINRITGADLTEDIFELANRHDYSVGIILWSRGLTTKKKLSAILKNKYPKLKYEIEEIADRTKINYKPKFKTDITFVALGSPYQELLINKIIKSEKTKTIALGVGQAIDFIAGTIRRAPKTFRQIGLEWLWRLIKQPWRIKRIINAVIIFPLKFIKWRFINPFLYRPNVVCFLYKYDGRGYKVLITERKDDKGHWQLPQGGKDGQNLITAAKREMTEELGTDKFKIKHYATKINKYKFPDQQLNEFGVAIKKAMGYKGQKQGVVYAEFLGNDEDINVSVWEHQNWKWVELDKLTDAINEKRRKAARPIMAEFNNYLKSLNK